MGSIIQLFLECVGMHVSCFPSVSSIKTIPIPSSRIKTQQLGQHNIAGIQPFVGQVDICARLEAVIDYYVYRRLLFPNPFLNINLNLPCICSMHYTGRIMKF